MASAGEGARSSARGLGQIALITVAMFFAAIYAHRLPDRISIGRIDQAVFVPGSVPVALDAMMESRGERVHLPHRWSGLQARPPAAWYLAQFELGALPDELWGVMLPSLRTAAAVYVNGEQIGSSGDIDGPGRERRWNHPLYYRLPGRLLAPGVNNIAIRVVSDTPGWGLLAPFHVGPDRVLHAAYERIRFFRVTLAEIVIAFSVTVSAFMAVLWLRRRRDTIYGWFALAIAAWTLHNLNLTVIHPPVPVVAWEWLWFTSVGVFVILVVVFIHRFLGYERPTVERVLFGAGVAGSLGLALLGAVDPSSMHFYGVQAWDAAVTALGLYPGVMMLNASRRLGVEGKALLVSGLLILSFGAHDWMTLAGLVDCANGLLMHLSAPVVIAAFVWILLGRFVLVLDEAEGLNRTLEQRVSDRTAEIARNYERIQRLEEHKAVARERERIMLDMHDGVGGQLVSLLALAESSQGGREDVVNGLRTALDELRLSIDSIDPDYTDLNAALSFLRQRMVPRLRSAGLAVTWPVDLPAIEGIHLRPAQLLQVVRVAQEALTNVLKHANANEVRITVGTEYRAGSAKQTVLEIIDDGQGMDAAHASGRGLRGMRRRAELIGGALDIESSAKGTRVWLLLPGSDDGTEAAS